MKSNPRLPLLANTVLAVSIFSLVGCNSNNDANESVEPTSHIDFKVLPYVQNPSSTAITINWLSKSEQPGTVTIEGIGSFVSEVKLTDRLTYGASEIDYIHGETNFGAIHPDVAAGEAPAVSYKHYTRITGLEANTTYEYTVVQPDSSAFTSSLKTAPNKGSREAVRFITMSDMETEPESTDKTVRWTASALALGGEKLGTDPDTYTRQYPVDQTTGYKENLIYATQRTPDFWVIAGDLVEKGGRQLDWDEFWRHSAGEWGTLASTTPIFPALGNHENYWHPDSPMVITPTHQCCHTINGIHIGIYLPMTPAMNDMKNDSTAWTMAQ
ncbi:metallophosphoesterase [Paraglaciecola aquimarina]|uniref:Metallophosphoesterase n=1 Tax=Paraglaciecola aquimarina TaxID=1235557 RepID=A0ABU3SUK8_9ALTE|nr:metallophosphoesterase [Paraglaciecola aquimarina]MDU0353699.1 metallophosphoesterase [Paraglaciecola aquimarina]